MSGRRLMWCGLAGRGCIWMHSHAPGITRVQHLLGQLEERLSDKRPAGIEYRRRALDSVPMLVFHFLHHGFHALGIRDIGRYTHCLTAGLIDGVNDRGVGVWVAGEEDDGVGGGEFAGNGCSGLWSLWLAFVLGGRRRRKEWGQGGVVGNVRLGRRRR